MSPKLLTIGERVEHIVLQIDSVERLADKDYWTDLSQKILAESKAELAYLRAREAFGYATVWVRE